jgi:(S)-2-hydroxyglutarate dehydrogenase
MFDFAIVGGGIVGLSTGLALNRRCPRAKILLLEKEPGWACHQTGRNSGVIHSGIYYKPGSLKAALAVEGNRRMVRFCQEHGIPHEVCGKVIVATRPEELPRLDALCERGQKNGLTLTKLDPGQLQEIEPHAAGLAAIHVPSMLGIRETGSQERKVPARPFLVSWLPHHQPSGAWRSRPTRAPSRLAC